MEWNIILSCSELDLNHPPRAFGCILDLSTKKPFLANQERQSNV